jgi:uncharacterized protein (TIGR00268 family)
MIPRLLSAVRTQGNTTSTSPTANLIAFSGGVDSSVVAALVHQVFPSTSTAVLGISSAVHQEQIDLARHVADTIGIPLHTVATQEGQIPQYVENAGDACFYCKTELYENLRAVGNAAAAWNGGDTGDTGGTGVVLFNGTNGDDAQDPTRVGLVAATNFQVASPLLKLTKVQVREAARLLLLPNHAHAASPCLRSRLALGVHATADHLHAVEAAERIVRAKLDLSVEHNLRVRLLSGGRSAVEIDAELLEKAKGILDGELRDLLSTHGFQNVEARAFKSGSVNGLGRTTAL